MGYPAKLLNDNEQVVLDLHPHWAYLFIPIMAVVMTIALAVATSILLPAEPVATYVAVGLLLLSMLMLVVRFVVWRSSNFVVTTDRIIHREGLFSKRGIEIPLERVQNIAFSQSFAERLLGAGDLLIESGGEGGQNRFTDVANPTRIQNEIYRQMEANNNRMYAGGRQAGLSSAEQLEKLALLRQHGVLSDAEFEREKRKLLG